MKDLQKFSVLPFSIKFIPLFFALVLIPLYSGLSQASVHSPGLKQTDLAELRKDAQPGEEAAEESDPQKAEAVSKELVELKEKGLAGKVQEDALLDYWMPGYSHQETERTLDKLDKIEKTLEQLETENKTSQDAIPEMKEGIPSPELISGEMAESSAGQTTEEQNRPGPAPSNAVSPIKSPILQMPEPGFTQPPANPLFQEEKSLQVSPGSLSNAGAATAAPSALSDAEAKERDQAAGPESRTEKIRNIYKVWRVYDGDSLRLEGDKQVVLIGTDAPEHFLNRKMFNESRRTKQTIASLRAAGRKAVKRTRQLARGKWVELEFDAQPKDKFGRLLAYVYLQDGTFLNAELIRSGYARAADPGLNTKFREYFLALEREARENERGFWKKQEPAASPV